MKPVDSSSKQSRSFITSTLGIAPTLPASSFNNPPHTRLPLLESLYSCACHKASDHRLRRPIFVGFLRPLTDGVVSVNFAFCSHPLPIVNRGYFRFRASFEEHQDRHLDNLERKHYRLPFHLAPAVRERSSAAASEDRPCLARLILSVSICRKHPGPQLFWAYHTNPKKDTFSAHALRP